MVRYGIIGSGRTGSEVIKLLPKYQILHIFNSNNLVTTQKLKECDICIIFVSSFVLSTLLPILIDSCVPVICGTTGFKWSENLKNIIKQKNCRWIISNNFSLSMFLIKYFFFFISSKIDFLITNNFFFFIEEIHHLNKKDSPSGTSILWKNWLNFKKCSIKSIRKLNVKGIHKFILQNDFEKITLIHSVLTRKIFANGALWAAKFLIKNKFFFGLNQFYDILLNI